MRFPTPDSAGGVEATNPLTGFDKNDIMRAAELAVLTLVGILMIFFVARPMLGLGGKKGKGAAGALESPQATRIVVTPDGQQMQIAADGTMTQLALSGPGGDARMEMGQIDGSVKASSVKRVSDFVASHPDESVSILRSWLHEAV